MPPFLAIIYGGGLCLAALMQLLYFIEKQPIKSNRMNTVDTVEAKVKVVKEIHLQGGRKVKSAIEVMFPKLFQRPVIERIKSYEDACADQGITPLKLSDFDFLPEKDREYHFEDHKQVIIVRALNEGWESNPNDPNEPKWYVWYKWVGSGVGFVFYYSYCVISCSGVGARHEFKTKALAEYYAKQFIGTVNKRFIIKK